MRRILSEQHPVAPAWMSPEWVVQNMPIEGDIVQRLDRRYDRIHVLCAVARRALRELAS